MTRHNPTSPADRMAAEQAMREQREREREARDAAGAAVYDAMVAAVTDDSRIITAEEQRAMAEALANSPPLIFETIEEASRITPSALLVKMMNDPVERARIARYAFALDPQMARRLGLERPPDDGT